MGLDWCVRNKIKPGLDELMVPGLEQQLQEAKEERDGLWKVWLAEGGHDQPNSWPNPLADEFARTEPAREADRKVKEIEDALEDCLVFPMQTLGAPRVGYDPEATEFARKVYQESVAGKSPDGLTEAEFLANSRGDYVPDLLKSSAGVGQVRGVAVGSESFRGKVLGYCDMVLNGTDLADQAYQDHGPEELVAYGQDLLDAAEEAEQTERDAIEQAIEDKANELEMEWWEDEDDEDYPDRTEFIEKAERELELSGCATDLTDGMEDQLRMVRDAGNWCIFWGSRGHGMHAWY